MGDLVTGMPEAGSGSLAVAIMAVSAALLLLVIVLWVIKAGRSKVMFMGTSKSRQPRLAILETAAVDQRRRLVLIRRDETEHLLLIGGPSDLVVEPAIGMRRKDLAHMLATEPEAAAPTAPVRDRPVVAPAQIVSAAGPSSDAVDVLDEARARVLREDTPQPERARSAPASPATAFPGPAASTDRQFPAERFSAPADTDPLDEPAPKVAPLPEPARPAAPQPAQRPAIVAGNPFGDDAFAAVLDAELSKDAAHLDVAPARDLRPAAPGAPAPATTAPRKEASLEEEMARLLSEMAEKRR
jgi:flagellar biogenesis protein FliO